MVHSRRTLDKIDDLDVAAELSDTTSARPRMGEDLLRVSAGFLPTLRIHPA